MIVMVIALSEDVASEVCACSVPQAMIASMGTRKHLSIICNKSDVRDIKRLCSAVSLKTIVIVQCADHEKHSLFIFASVIAMKGFRQQCYMNRKTLRVTEIGFDGLPARRGPRPKTIRGPLHIQCNEHGDPRYLNELVDEVRTWPHIESAAPVSNRPNTIPIRLMEKATSSDPSAFITAREFARVLLGAPTIYLALPLVWAHWAIVRGWAEPHYLGSCGLMPAGAVVVYTPKEDEEREVCTFLLSECYHCACTFAGVRASGPSTLTC